VLDTIWNLAPTRAKSRSSKKEVSDAWKRIPAKDKPNDEALIASFNKWIHSEDWTKDSGQFVGGLHLWIKNKKWEVEPTPANKPTKKGANADGFGV
jgi:hypothetical protein